MAKTTKSSIKGIARKTDVKSPLKPVHFNGPEVAPKTTPKKSASSSSPAGAASFHKTKAKADGNRKKRNKGRA